MAATIVSPALVGRVAELAELRFALASAMEGQPVTVLLGGEAGVGKTRLVTEFAAEAAANGARVVVGQCVELGGDGLPFAPVAGALRDLVAQLGADELLQLAGPGRDALAGLLPELGVRATDLTEGRGRLFEVVTVLLERVSADRPLLLVVEDLHWADGSTRDLLRFAVRGLSSARVTVIGTYRSDEIHRAHPLRPFLAELDRLRSVRRLDVPRLSHSEVGEQLAGIMGEAPAVDAVARIYQRSDGIPFLVEELARAETDDDHASLPDSLRDLLLVPVERLSPTAQSVLRLLAAGGNRVDDAVLAQVADLDARSLDVALREAVSANIVRVDGEGFTFRHALLREVLHDDLLPGAHARLHRRYAEVIEEHPELVSAGSAAVEVAHHWYAAHELPRAFRASLTAADDALHAHAYGEAQLMLERALELWHCVPDPVAASGGDRVDLLKRAALAAVDAGEPERALSLAEAALAEVDGEADPLRIGSLLVVRGKLLSELGRPEAMAVLQQGLDLVPADPPSDPRAQLLQMLSARLLLDGRFDEAADVGLEAASAARAASVPFAEFRAYNIRGPALIQLGRIDEGFDVLDTSRRLAGDVPRMLVSYHVNASDVLNLLGRYEEAVQVARDGIDRAREIGLVRGLGAMLAGNAAEPLLALGEWDEAHQLITRGLELDPPLRHFWHLLRLQSWLLMWRGDLARAGQALNELRTLTARRSPGPQYTIPASALAGELALAGDDPDEAWNQIASEVTEPRRPIPGYDLPMLAVAARALGAKARTSIASLAPEVGRVRAILDSHGDWATAPVWRAVVEAELSGGVGADPAAWRAAVDTADAAGGPAHLRPYARYRLAAAALDGTERRETAATALREAAEQAERLGAQLLRGWIDTLSRRAGIPLLDAVPGDRDDTAGELHLTPREREVLRLVAAGRSNRQIGEELFISTKTASVHVSNILAKLGVSGRGEAAAVAHRANLLDEDARRPA